MTTSSDFTEQEWEQVLEGPPSAGMIVITAQRGGTFRETISMAKAYAEARKEHGQSELLDTIVSAKPEIDHTRYRSPEELKEHALAHIRDAVSLLRSKAQPEELDEYRRFVMNLSRKVADAHREGGRGEDATSEDEQRALADVEQALG